jgi:aminopeptidase N
MIAVYDDEGWNGEIPDTKGDVVYGDAGFYIVRVDAPGGLTLVTSGRELTRQETAGRQQVTFAAGPARDFYIAASREFQHLQQQVGETIINLYPVPPYSSATADQGLDYAVQAIQDFSERYAPYPYTEFDVVMVPTMALGIEYPGVVAIVKEALSPESGMDVYLESTIVHETGHQWFYSLVGNDQVDEPYLDESLTQYITWQYYKDQGHGDAYLIEDLELRWPPGFGDKIPIGQKVQAYDEWEYSSIIYGRGAFFFDALQKKMGQATFDKFMKDYVSTFAWGIATTEGLKKVAEQDCGCDLTALFEEWVYP